MENSQPRLEPPPPYSVSKWYEYKPVGTGQVRLLTLNGAQSFDEPLHCNIASYPMTGEGRPCYTTLSYVWGNGINSHEVHCEDKILLIGRNLNSALRHLRHRQKPFLLWVDALCIDQGNVEERNHQVSLMRDIYSSAEETIVYLGDLSNNGSLSAWNYLERHSAWGLNDDHEKDRTRPAMVENLNEFRGDLYDVCHEVLSRDWFKRTWVIQEAVVSRAISLQCGPRRIPWDDFIKITVLHPRKHDRYGLSLTQQRLFDQLNLIWKTRVAFQVSHDQEHNLPSWHKQLKPDDNRKLSTDILDIMMLARELRATDPRDKIFALVGLSSGFDWVGFGTIDYSKSVAEVYTTFARDVMMGRNDYQAMSYLCWKPEYCKPQWMAMRVTRILTQMFPSYTDNSVTAGGRNSLPSWVNDWDYMQKHNYQAISEFVAAQNLAPNAQRGAGLPPLRVELFRTWLPADVLAIHGRVLGVLDGYKRSLSLSWGEGMYFDDLRKQWPQSPHSRYYSLESYILAKWDLLLTTSDPDRRFPGPPQSLVGLRIIPRACL